MLLIAKLFNRHSGILHYLDELIPLSFNIIFAHSNLLHSDIFILRSYILYSVYVEFYYIPFRQKIAESCSFSFDDPDIYCLLNCICRPPMFNMINHMNESNIMCFCILLSPSILCSLPLHLQTKYIFYFIHLFCLQSISYFSICVGLNIYLIYLFYLQVIYFT